MNVLVTGAEAPLARELAAALRRDPAIGCVLEVTSEEVAKPRRVHDLIGGTARALGIEAVFHDPARGGAAASTACLLRACSHHPWIRRFVLRSGVDVYQRLAAEPDLGDEEIPLAMEASDRVAADVAASTHAGDGPLAVAVLRFADILGSGIAGPLADYLAGRVCLRPLGLDPMIGVLSLEDAIHAATLALRSEARGAFDIPGAEALPLCRLLARCGRRGVPVPSPLLAIPHALREAFRAGTLHSGRRARQELGYRPSHPIAWTS